MLNKYISLRQFSPMLLAFAYFFFFLLLAMPRPKKTHDANSYLICIGCLKRPKPKFTSNIALKNGENVIENLISSRIYSDFFQERDYLPQVICCNCKSNLKNETCDFKVLVDYKSLVENVKQEQNKVKNSNNDEKCLCELCRLGSIVVNPNAKNKAVYLNSPFLLEDRTVSVIPKGKMPKITDFFTTSRDQTKNEKIQDILEFTDQDSLAQLLAAYAEKQAKLLGKHEFPVKRVHGPPLTLTVGGHACPKTVIEHRTFFRIIAETNTTGNRVVQIAKILKDDCGLKIEEYFKEAVVERNHAVEEFFDDKLLEVYVYEKKDFQMWHMTEESNLIDKVKLVEF